WTRSDLSGNRFITKKLPKNGSSRSRRCIPYSAPCKGDPSQGTRQDLPSPLFLAVYQLPGTPFAIQPGHLFDGIAFAGHRIGWGRTLSIFCACCSLVSMPLNLLSIQSSVAYGHVGNCAAVFPLQRIGVEVWPVNTVHFSNHTGYGTWRGLVLPVESVEDVIRGIEERKVLHRCAGVLSGYMGDVSL